MKILSISWGNLEKLIQIKLKSINHNCNESGIKKNKILRDKYISIPHKIKIKYRVLIKTNLDLSLMWYLFGIEYEVNFHEDEKHMMKLIRAK